MVAMISGPLHLSDHEFKLHFVPQLRVALARGHTFIVSDCPSGTDARVQKYLRAMGAAHQLTVFHRFDGPREAVRSARVRGGFTRERDLDIAMTAESTYDILWYRGFDTIDGEEACWKNVPRRFLTRPERNQRRRHLYNTKRAPAKHQLE